MSDSDYYPAGAYNDPSAPYNEVSVPEKEFEITCCQVLSKSVTVITDDYIPGGWGVDEDGGFHDSDDTSDTNWAEEYHSNDHYTPLQLIELFKQFLEEQKSHGIVFKSPKFTDLIIKECEDWEEDEIEYTE